MAVTELSGSRSARLRALHLFLAAIAFAGAFTWFILVWRNRATAEFWQRDWFCLWSVGRRLLTGEWRSVYREACAPGYLWLYPPYAMYPWSGIAHLPPLIAYAVVMVGSIVATAAAMMLLARTLPRERPFETVALATFGSAAFNATLVTGQHAAWLLLAITGAMWAASRNRSVLTGLFVGLLGFKPNWVVVFVLWLAVTRRWKALLTTATVGLVLVASTIPLGLDIWRDYLAAATGRIQLSEWTAAGDYPVWKLITVEAFFRSLFGEGPGVRSLSILTAIGIVLLAAWSWWRRPPDPTRQVAVATIAVIAANPYVSFYDALVLALPAAVWWTAPSKYASRARVGIGICVVGVWMGQWIALYALRLSEQPSLTGGILLAWLALETLVTRREGELSAGRPSAVP